MMLETWKEATDNNKAFDALLTDLLKAFDGLKSDSHVPENVSQTKIFPSLTQKSTIICLFGI